MVEVCAALLVCGLLVAIDNDIKMARECGDYWKWNSADRAIEMVRAMLAWPTYVAEEFLGWWRGASADRQAD